MAPNRLLPGQPVFAVQALGFAVYPIAALLLAAEYPWRGARQVVPLVLIGAAILLAMFGTGFAAAALLQGRAPAARAMLGSGFWLALSSMIALALMHATARKDRRKAPVILALALVLAAAVVAGAAAGAFDGLSLMVEYRARMPAVHAAFAQHIVLASGALALAFLATVPLGWAGFRSPRVEAAVNGVLGVLQVTPALALFGLLIPLLAALLALAPFLRSLGIGAIGPAPALVGVAIYLALPLLRGFVGGLKAADPAIVEAARAMGMTERRVTVEVRIPLGLPIIMGALRVAAVQSIGLMTLGGLIGAGGLGAVVFEGMSQLAADLILLGALPIMVLALAADAGMAAACRAIEGSSR